MSEETNPSNYEHRPLADLNDALVFLEEVEFVMSHAPIKQHDRTPDEQKAVERYTTYCVWIRDVLRQHGCLRYADPPAPTLPEESD